MKALILLVEGETEQEFVNRILAPYLITKGLNTEIRPIMIEKSGGGHGYSNIEHLKNTIRPVLNRVDEPIVTTLIDHYGLNSEHKLPGFTSITTTDTEVRIQQMEDILQSEIQKIKAYRFFIPYIQRHEFETLLFANPEVGFDLEKDKIKEEVVKLCGEFKSIEDINSTPEGAPSKRLGRIYEAQKKKYNKVADAVDIIELTGIESVFDKCPRFKNWVEKLIGLVKED
jgi:hypothetical protein